MDVVRRIKDDDRRLPPSLELGDLECGSEVEGASKPNLENEH